MEEDEWNYRNADHRTGAGGFWGTIQPRPVPPPAPVPAPRPMPSSPAYYPPQQPAPYYGAPGYPPTPYGYPPPGYPPMYGQPYPGWPWPPRSVNWSAIGRVVRAATPIIVSLLPGPTMPTAAAPTGDVGTDVKASLTNEANMIQYQDAIVKMAKRDEALIGIGEGIGLLMEKGLSS
jgi:hypothetical protein